IKVNHPNTAVIVFSEYFDFDDFTIQRENLKADAYLNKLAGLEKIVNLIRNLSELKDSILFEVKNYYDKSVLKYIEEEKTVIAWGLWSHIEKTFRELYHNISDKRKLKYFKVAIEEDILKNKKRFEEIVKEGSLLENFREIKLKAIRIVPFKELLLSSLYKKAIAKLIKQLTKEIKENHALSTGRECAYYRLGGIYYTLAVISHLKKRSQRAKSFYLKAIQNYKEVALKFGQFLAVQSKIEIARVYEAMRNYELALVNYEALVRKKYYIPIFVGLEVIGEEDYKTIASTQELFKEKLLSELNELKEKIKKEKKLAKKEKKKNRYRMFFAWTLANIAHLYQHSIEFYKNRADLKEEALRNYIINLKVVLKIIEKIIQYRYVTRENLSISLNILKVIEQVDLISFKESSEFRQKIKELIEVSEGILAKRKNKTPLLIIPLIILSFLGFSLNAQIPQYHQINLHYYDSEIQEVSSYRGLLDEIKGYYDNLFKDNKEEKIIRESIVNHLLYKKLASILGYNFFSPPGGLKGEDYFEQLLNRVKESYLDNSLIVEGHLNSPFPSYYANDKRFSSRNCLFFFKEDNRTYIATVDKNKKVISKKYRGLVSNFLDKEKTVIFEFSTLEGFFELSEEDFIEKQNEVRIILNWYFKKYPQYKNRTIVFVPGHGGLNWKDSHHITSKGYHSIGGSISWDKAFKKTKLASKGSSSPLDKNSRLRQRDEKNSDLPSVAGGDRNFLAQPILKEHIIRLQSSIILREEISKVSKLKGFLIPTEEGIKLISYFVKGTNKPVILIIDGDMGVGKTELAYFMSKGVLGLERDKILHIEGDWIASDQQLVESIDRFLKEEKKLLIFEGIISTQQFFQVIHQIPKILNKVNLLQIELPWGYGGANFSRMIDLIHPEQLLSVFEYINFVLE
ncbi:MAG: hypothetical protein NC903_03335, partial [Candidatus Omnitrophica bacterium]|nr:hypothetical protein [Candidatus Omnitrophota bacterium]